MPFVENGRVVERRSMMRVATLADIFWGVLNGIYALCVDPFPIPRVCSLSSLFAALVPQCVDTFHFFPAASTA
jgi:hypothetical protein